MLMKKYGLRMCLALTQLVASGEISVDDAAKWREIDREVLSLHTNTKELLWYSNLRLTREYSTSPEGLGRVSPSGD